jgi:ankyrin repeat protein
MVRLLLERGAKPNDGESIYHAAELNRSECLELLLAHGADISGAQSARRNTPLYFLSCFQESHAGLEASVEGMRWLLEHGADPNLPSGQERETPLHRVAAQGRSVAVVEMLLAHGADPNCERADGRAPYVLAVRTGNTSLADCLRAHGARTNGVTPLDELLGACMRGNGAAARALVTGHPALMASLPEADRSAVVHAVYQKKPEALRVMAEMGFDLAWEGEWGGTPLHHAAWLGLVEMVRALLLLGAPVNVRDGRYGSSPLGWGAHGSHHCREADDDYIRIVDLLLDAGSDRETSINKWGEAPESLGSRRVDAHLKARLRARPNEH